MDPFSIDSDQLAENRDIFAAFDEGSSSAGQFDVLGSPSEQAASSQLPPSPDNNDAMNTARTGATFDAFTDDQPADSANEVVDKVTTRFTNQDDSAAPSALGSELPPSILDGLHPLLALPAPSPPTLSNASINSLSLSWTPVEEASGYFVDYEFRSGVDGDPEGVLLSGTGGRVVNGGMALLPATAQPRCRITGLHKNACYVVTVTAVRRRRVVLPDGQALEQIVDSPPSPAGGPFRTLAAGAEIARLQAENNRLTRENDRIPELEEESEALSAQLSETSHQLSDALGEVARLTAELAERTDECDAAQARIGSLGGELESANAVIAHLTNELSIARGAIESLSADVSARDASLLAAAAEVEAARASEASRSQAAEEAVHQVNDAQAEIGARDGRIAALQAELDASKRASIDLSGEKDLLVGKLTGDLAKVMDELDRIQEQLHTSQDYIQYIEPAAKLVLDIRGKQAAWDKAHRDIEDGYAPSGPHASGGNAGKRAALKKLGARPELTL